jgi:hypothetical protein
VLWYTHSIGCEIATRAEREEKLMITQIELDGFKAFKDFKVELAPFQSIN